MSNKIKHTCGDIIQATCVEYQTPLPEFSEITGCPDLDATTAELYEIAGEIKEETNLSELGEKCLTYTTVEGKVFVKNALLTLEEEICLLKEEVEALKNRQLCDIPIGECITDFSCLIGECENSINTLGDWMTAVQNKICTP